MSDKRMSMFLKDYVMEPVANKSIDDEFNFPVSELGMEIVELINKKKPTYVAAYASLQWAYDCLKYQSNFVQVPDTRILPSQNEEE